MVYVHFPTHLTEEELMLQGKYQKLKKKKKALQNLNAPKQEQEKVSSLKRPRDSKDAKEVAKKLLKTGAITPIQKTDKNEKTVFKRSRGLEKKLSGADRALSGYQPFSATHPEDEVVPECRPRVKEVKKKNLYDSFVAARDREERGLPEPKEKEGPPPKPVEKPRQGNTVYVFGYNITEDILQRAFQTFGNIVNISMEIEKNCGFVTFDKVESTERSIQEMNGSMVSGIQIKVSLARRQPVIEPINDASSSATWSTIAASHSQKGSHRDKRDLVAYDNDLF